MCARLFAANYTLHCEAEDVAPVLILIMRSVSCLYASCMPPRVRNVEGIVGDRTDPEPATQLVAAA